MGFSPSRREDLSAVAWTLVFGVARCIRKPLFKLQMQLSITEDGYVHNGDKVMLVNLDHPEVEADVFLRGDLSLCLTPDEIRAHLSDKFEVPCGLSAAPTKIPVGRNTFTILR